MIVSFLHVCDNNLASFLAATRSPLFIQNVTAYPFYRMERPKVFKCPATGKYMLWFHCGA